MMKKFIVSVLFSSMTLFGFGDVLQWQIDQYADVDGGPTTVYSFLEPDREIGALACVYDANGNFIKNLNLVYEPDYADSFVSSRSELGMMQAIQSSLDDELALESLFQLQIGYYDDDFNFVPALYSSTETKNKFYWQVIRMQ